MRFLPAILITCSLFVASACSGGGSNTETASLIHRLLQGAPSTQSGQLESFPGKLPPGLPAKPPQYPGATLIVSSREPAATGAIEPTPDASGKIAQPMLYLIVLDTAAARDKVYSYYENALEKDPWQIANTFSTEDLDTLQFSNVSDADISGVVSIARGGQDNRTSVLISLQDAGAFREKLPPFKLATSVPVPKLFPSDVALYKGATFTGSAFVREPGDESFLVIFLTKDSKETVTGFYRSAFQKLGWVIQAGAPLGVEQRFNFQDATADVHGDLLANAFARDSTYTEVRLQVHQKPSRPPATTTPQATAASTRQPTPVSTPQPTAG